MITISDGCGGEFKEWAREKHNDHVDIYYSCVRCGARITVHTTAPFEATERMVKLDGEKP